MKVSKNREKSFIDSKICFYNKKILFLLTVSCVLIFYCLSGRFVQPKCLNLNSNILLSEKQTNLSFNSQIFSYTSLHRIKQELLYLFEFINEEESLSHNELLKKELLQRQLSLNSITDHLIEENNIKTEAEAKSLQLYAQQAISRNQVSR